jgi:ABC-2 type transport system ATP-binding protein
MLKPNNGSLRIDGLDCWKQSHIIKERVSFLHEDVEYPQGVSAIDYLTFVGRIRKMPKEPARQQAKELIDYLNLSEHSSKSIFEFSKGMKKLVGIGAAIIGNPNLIIMDEPTANLDPSGRFLVMDLVNQLHREKGIGFLISSHILHELERVCTSVGFLFGGNILATGTTDEILGNIPHTNLIIRVRKTDLVLRTLLELEPKLDAELSSGRIIVRNRDIEYVSGILNKAVQQNNSLILEFRTEDSDLERIYKILAGRYGH